jgi:pyruvate dehydrogenase E2 component (dihydrolipoyllysine-residue acetyltransferase)
MEEIFVPASGMAMEDVLFTEWLKQPGDAVEAGEPVAVVETDKSTVELSGTTAGTLSRHLVEAGARVPGGTTVAYLLGEGESVPGADPSEATAARTGGEQLVPPAPARSGQSEPEGNGHGQVLAGAATEWSEREPDGRHRLSPRQRRAMAEMAAGKAETAPEAASPPRRFVPQGLRSAKIPPPVAVPVGRAEASASSAPQGRRGAETRVETAPVGAVPDGRRATAALVSESWRTVPHFSVGRDIRVDGLFEAAAAGKAAGVGLTATDFLILALADALESVGEASDLGLAVATEWGVLIPVLPSVAGKPLADVAKQRESAVARARSRRLTSGDSAPVFATLSNLGPAGVTWFTGVIPVNQVALVTVGEVSLRPAVEGRGLVVAPMITAVVTADHRRYDGVDSARLLSAFAENLRGVIDQAIINRGGR